MKTPLIVAALFLAVTTASPTPSGYFKQEHSFKESSQSFVNNELQQKKEKAGFYAKEGDHVSPPKVQEYFTENEYRNPNLDAGSNSGSAGAYTHGGSVAGLHGAGASSAYSRGTGGYGGYQQQVRTDEEFERLKHKLESEIGRLNDNTAHGSTYGSSSHSSHSSSSRSSHLNDNGFRTVPLYNIPAVGSSSSSSSSQTERRSNYGSTHGAYVPIATGASLTENEDFSTSSITQQKLTPVVIQPVVSSVSQSKEQRSSYTQRSGSQPVVVPIVPASIRDEEEYSSLSQHRITPSVVPEYSSLTENKERHSQRTSSTHHRQPVVAPIVSSNLREAEDYSSSISQHRLTPVVPVGGTVTHSKERSSYTQRTSHPVVPVVPIVPVSSSVTQERSSYSQRTSQPVVAPLVSSSLTATEDCDEFEDVTQQRLTPLQPVAAVTQNKESSSYSSNYRTSGTVPISSSLTRTSDVDAYDSQRRVFPNKPNYNRQHDQYSSQQNYQSSYGVKPEPITQTPKPSGGFSSYSSWSSQSAWSSSGGGSRGATRNIEQDDEEDDTQRVLSANIRGGDIAASSSSEKHYSRSETTRNDRLTVPVSPLQSHSQSRVAASSSSQYVIPTRVQVVRTEPIYARYEDLTEEERQRVEVPVGAVHQTHTQQKESVRSSSYSSSVPVVPAVTSSAAYTSHQQRSSSSTSGGYGAHHAASSLTAAAEDCDDTQQYILPAATHEILNTPSQKYHSTSRTHHRITRTLPLPSDQNEKVDISSSSSLSHHKRVLHKNIRSAADVQQPLRMSMNATDNVNANMQMVDKDARLKEDLLLSALANRADREKPQHSDDITDPAVAATIEDEAQRRDALSRIAFGNYHGNIQSQQQDDFYTRNETAEHQPKSVSATTERLPSSSANYKQQNRTSPQGEGMWIHGWDQRRI